MIDLNDVWTPPARIDLAAVRARLAETAADWLPDLFPQAQRSRDGRILRCADLSGRPPRREGSCAIYLDGPYAGWGFDYATGERAGPIDLIYHATGLTDGALFEEARAPRGMDQPAPPRRRCGRSRTTAWRSGASSTDAVRSREPPPRPTCRPRPQRSSIAGPPLPP